MADLKYECVHEACQQEPITLRLFGGHISDETGLTLFCLHQKKSSVSGVPYRAMENYNSGQPFF